MSAPCRVLSVIPPMTQLNTPYPSTAYLTGFLREQGVDARQEDLALALVLELFSPAGLEAIHSRCEALAERKRSRQVRHFLAHYARYHATVAAAIAFLQGRDPTVGHRIAGRAFLPEGQRFASLDVFVSAEGADPLAWAFGALGTHDRARHLATLYLNDLADVLRDAVDARFEFVRYGESLAQSQASFDPLAQALAAPANLIDETLARLTKEALARHAPRVVLLSVPFPGSVYGAFRIAQAIKAHDPSIVTVLGGGFANTELRELAEPRVFDFFDYVTLDAGERPLLALLEHRDGKRPREKLVRTFRRATGKVEYIDFREPDIPFAQTGTPTWVGLPLHSYLSVLDMLNPMHRLWSDGRWNKLTVAHGCYWKKCTFCDVTNHRNARALVLLGKVVRKNRHLDAKQRRRDGGAEQTLVALVVRMRHQGDTSSQQLRSGRFNLDVAVPVRAMKGDAVVRGWLLFVFKLGLGYRGAEGDVPQGWRIRLVGLAAGEIAQEGPLGGRLGVVTDGAVGQRPVNAEAELPPEVLELFLVLCGELFA